MQPQESTVTIVKVPCFIEAWLDGDQLTVYRSVLVHDDEEMFAPVRDLLKTPHRIVLAEVVQDDKMMFGEGLLSVYRFDR